VNRILSAGIEKVRPFLSALQTRFPSWRIVLIPAALIIIIPCLLIPLRAAKPSTYGPTQDDGSWFFIPREDYPSDNKHTGHAATLGKYVTGYNYYVLRGVDIVQATAMDGGGYFIGVKADPPESPVGYEIGLFGKPLLAPPRTTSYCSGSSYAAFIEALNIIFPHGGEFLEPHRMEAMRMQEPDGGRREDGIKYWGHWNADGNGSQFALVQYSGMGEEIEPRRARPGDFMNITWTHGGGHSVVFLGWLKGENGKIGLAFWSSQKGTNGYSDVYQESVDNIKAVKIVRLTRPENLFSFDPATPVDIRVKGDPIDYKGE